MANVSLSRSGEVNWVTRAGDTFSPGPVAFTIDEVAESFAGATLKMQIKDGAHVVHTLTESSGITVSTNTLQYLISAADMSSKLPTGTYRYDVQKTLSGIVSTIQHGTITVTEEVTT